MFGMWVSDNCERLAPAVGDTGQTAHGPVVVVLGWASVCTAQPVFWGGPGATVVVGVQEVGPVHSPSQWPRRSSISAARTTANLRSIWRVQTIIRGRSSRCCRRRPRCVGGIGQGVVNTSLRPLFPAPYGRPGGPRWWRISAAKGGGGRGRGGQSADVVWGLSVFPRHCAVVDRCSDGRVCCTDPPGIPRI